MDLWFYPHSFFYVLMYLCLVITGLVAMVNMEFLCCGRKSFLTFVIVLFLLYTMAAVRACSVPATQPSKVHAEMMCEKKSRSHVTLASCGGVKKSSQQRF